MVMTEDQKHCPYCHKPFEAIHIHLIEQSVPLPEKELKEPIKIIAKHSDAYAFVAGNTLVTNFKGDKDKYYILETSIIHCPICGRKLINNSEFWKIPGDNNNENFEED